MFDPAEMAERHRRALAEITEQGLVAARDIQARLLAAESLEEAAAAGLALQRMHRSVRQSVALEARVARELRRLDREDREELQKQADAVTARRKAQVKAAVERAIRAEYDPDEADGLILDVDDLIDAEATADDFAEAPLAAQVARLRAALGMAPEEAEEGEGPADSDPATAEAPAGLSAASDVTFDAAEPPERSAPTPAWRSSG